MCSVHWGNVLSTSGGVQYIRGYHQYIGEGGGYHEYIGGCSVHWGISFMHDDMMMISPDVLNMP